MSIAMDEESMTSIPSISDEEDKLKDLALMEDIRRSIVAYQEPLDAEISTKSEFDEASSARAIENLHLMSMSVEELDRFIEVVTKAIEKNSLLQNVLLMKEIRLIVIKKQITSSGTHQAASLDEAKRPDIGRFLCKFKAPYFKNSNNFASYSIVRENNRPPSIQKFEDISTQWTKNDLAELENNVKRFLSSSSFKRILDKKEEEPKDNCALIDSYHYLKYKASMNQLLKENELVGIDWGYVSSKMKRRHNPNECMKAWDMYLKPELNRRKWCKEETTSLQKIALEHNYEGWDEIANELNTGRSGYQCFLYYVDKMRKLGSGTWSTAEEEFLVKLVGENTYGTKVLWHKMAYYFETRTISQLYRKWVGSNVGKNNKTGRFTSEEDKIILNSLVLNKGSIVDVSTVLNRLPCQVQYRYSQLKRTMSRKLGEWSLEEDKSLMDLAGTHGKNWAVIAKHFPGRCRIQIRHRYNHITKRIALDPDFKLEDFLRSKRSSYCDRHEENLQFVMSRAGNIKKLGGNRTKPDDTPPKTQKGKTKKSKKVTEETDKVKPSSTAKKTKTLEKWTHQPILDYYSACNQHIRSAGRNAQSTKTSTESSTVNLALKFQPYKHFDKENADWYYNEDVSDPYYEYIFKSVDCKPDTEELTNMRLGSHSGVLPPNTMASRALHNVLVDLSLKDEDLDSVTDEEDLQDLYSSNDTETTAAVETWTKRLRTLFLWSAVLSEIDLEEKDDGKTECDSEDAIAETTPAPSVKPARKPRGRPKKSLGPTPLRNPTN